MTVLPLIGKTALDPRMASADVVIRPRDEWAQGRDPIGPILPEEDVRFLLVHHTAGSNEYGQNDVPAQLRAIYDQHTTVKGWPDIAYNYLIDRFGTIWEGRQGSRDGPIRGDATGGSQGFALLCCFLGHHSENAPTDAAQTAMVELLASLAIRYDIPVGPDATTSFISRGSNLWPEGAEVTTPTIAGHRQMSQTECPGDVAFALVEDEFPAAVAGLVAAGSPQSTTTTVAAPATSTSTSTSSSTSTTTLTTSSSTTSSSVVPPSSELAGGPSPASSDTDFSGVPDLLLASGGALALAGAALGALWLRRRLDTES